ncbi:MAG: twin-arginine translocation signal domain-containing protein, partial [Candidatus Heimdallarchaeota archaeon]
MSEEEVTDPSRRRFLKLGMYTAAGVAAVVGVGSVMNA